MSMDKVKSKTFFPLVWSPLMRRHLSTTFYGLFFNHHITQSHVTNSWCAQLPCTALYTCALTLWVLVVVLFLFLAIMAPICALPPLQPQGLLSSRILACPPGFILVHLVYVILLPGIPQTPR